MDKTISITLNGHPAPYRLEPAAYEALERYLDRATAGLADDPDRADVLGDLERSVGDRLAALPESARLVVSAADIERILDEIGSVETGQPTVAPQAPAAPPRRRRLERIRERQQLAGVCAGIAEYAQLDVNWVRLGFLAATTATAGAFALVYAGLAIILPVAEPSRTGSAPR